MKGVFARVIAAVSAAAIIGVSVPADALLVASDIQAVSSGMITSQVEAASKKKNLTVRVEKQRDYIEKTVYVGTKYQIKLKGAKKATYKSSNTKIAKISGKGLITLKKYGKVNITIVGNNKKSAVLELTVIDPKIGSDIKSISIVDKTSSLYIGESAPVATVKFNPVSPSNTMLNYESSNTEILRIIGDGTIYGVAKGSAKVTISTLNGKKTSYTVRVKESSKNDEDDNAAKIQQDAEDESDTGTLAETTGSDGHTHKKGSWEVTQEATCQNTGTKIRKCTVCGDTIATQTISKKAHSGSWSVKTAATCSSTGLKVRTCNMCGNVYDQKTIAVTSHSWVWNETKASTCAEAGIKTQICSFCGTTGTTSSISKLTNDSDHVWTVKSNTAATCTQKGTVVYECSVCGKTKTASNVAEGHHFGTPTVTKAATCGENGKQEERCTVCGYVKTSTIKKTGKHQMITEHTEPTCTTKGGSIRICSVCRGSDTKSVLTTEDALGHSYTHVKTDSTCQMAGAEYDVCTRPGCTDKTSGHIKNKKTIAKKAHNLQWKVTSAKVSKKKVTIKEAQVCTVCGMQQKAASGSASMPSEHKAAKHYYKVTASTGQIIVKCISCKKKSTGKISGNTISFGAVSKSDDKISGFTKF